MTALPKASESGATESGATQRAATQSAAAPDMRSRYREAIARFATGVTVVTTRDGDRLAGMTASAVASLSLEPLLLLVCVNNHLPTHAALERSSRFAVNVLGEGDEQLALRFARPSSEKFAGLAVDHDHGPPLIRRAIAHFVCDTKERLPGGDHSIFIGEIRHCAYTPGRAPLLWFASAFGALQQADDAFARGCELWGMAGI
jgi:3-hydroxy-9,10-secoandrosta-1,3,5(10)-triene-9,17-dione monooxygenase reductase component